MTKMQTETRFAAFEDVRFEADDNGTVEGYAVVFGKPADIGGLFTEYIDRGAIGEKVLKDVQFLVNHNEGGITLARSRHNNENSTMQLKVDDTGLRVKAKLDIDNNAEARALYSAIKRGDVSGMSFRFCVGKDAWEDLDTDHPVRHVQEITYLPEVSAVNMPAYQDTSIQARSEDSARALECARAALESEKAPMLELEKAKNHNYLI